MKYLSFKTVKVALHRIVNDEYPMEHRTSTVGNSLLANYFPLQKYTVTPEQEIPYSRKKPDFTVERLDNNDNLVYHAIAEMKSYDGANFTKIIDQVYDSIMPYAEATGGNFSVYVIAIKGVSIGFFQFFNCIPLLDALNIPHYKGFIPLNKLMLAHDYMSVHNISNIVDYFQHLRLSRVNMYLYRYRLRDVKMPDGMDFPCIFNLLNEKHENYVHDLFVHMANNTPETYMFTQN